MASRVNTKFVVILSTLIVLAVIAVAGFWYLFVRTDPQKLIAEGNAFMQQGQVQAAVDDYQKALQARGNDVGLMVTMVDALKKLPVSDPVDASKVFGNIRGLTRRASDLSPTNQKLLISYYASELHYGQLFDEQGFYSKLQEATNAKLTSDPSNMIALKYRGITKVLLLNASMTDAEQLRARDDLRKVVKADPKDAESLYYLARWNLDQAAQVKQNGGQDAKREAYVKRAAALAGQVLKAGGDDLQAKLWAAQIYVNSLVNMKAKAKPLVDEIDAALLKDPTPPRRVLAVIDLVAQMDTGSQAGDAKASQATPANLVRVEQLLAAAMKREPGNARYTLAMAQLLRSQGKIPQAIAALEKGRVSASKGNALAVLLGQRQRTKAGVEEAQLLLASTNTGSGAGTEPSASLRQAADVIKDLASNHNDDAPTINMLKGWLALKEGNNQVAAKRLNRASTQMADNNPLLLQLSAQAFERIGQWGAAAGQLEKCVALTPDVAGLRIRLAVLYLKHNRVQDASAQVKQALTLAPGFAPAKLLSADLLKRAGHYKQAMAIYQSMDPAENPTVIPSIASLEMALGDEAKAMALLHKRFDAAPTDLSTLGMLLRLTKSKPQRLAMIDRSAKAGLNPQIVDSLRTVVSGTGEDAEVRLNKFLGTEKDPVQRDLAKARFHLQQGEVKKARADLAGAAKAAPDNPMVVRMQFELALKDHNWDKAKQLAAKAGTLDLDHAKGAFFAGDLAFAQRKWAEAVADYQRGLSVRPIFSKGQRVLGDALAAQGNYSQAKQAFEQALQQRPDNVNALQGLASIANKQGDHAAALGYFKQAIAVAPDNLPLKLAYASYAQRYGDEHEAMKVRLEIAKVAPKLRPNLRALAVLHAQVGEGAAAEKIVKQLAAGGVTQESVQVQLAVDAILGKKQAGEKAVAAYIAQLGKKVTAQDYLMLAHYRMIIGDGQGMMQAYHQAMAIENPKTQLASRELADLLLSRHMDSQAAALYQTLVKKHPKDDGLKLRLGVALIRENKLNAAQKLIAPIQSNAQATALQAMIAERQGNDDQALTLFNQAISSGATTSAIYFGRAQLLAKQGKTDDAVDDLNRAIATNPRYLPARALLVQLALAAGQFDKAETDLNAILKQDPSNGQARMQLVAVYRQQGDPTSARTILADAIKRFPKQATWPGLMGQVLYQQGDTAGALKNWSQAVALSPTPANLAIYIQALMRQKQAGQAIAVLNDHAGELNKHPMLQGLKAEALVATGEGGKATTLFSHALTRAADRQTYQGIVQQMVQSLGTKSALAQVQAVAASGSAHPAWPAIAQAAVYIGQGQFSQALTHLQSIHTPVSKDDRSAIDHLEAVSLAKTGQYVKARQAYERILTAAPDDADTMNNLAFLLANHLDKPKEAAAMALKALKVQPNSPQFLDTLGWAQFKAGQADDARQTLEKSVQIQPMAENNYHLACVYQSLGVPHRATALLNQALALAKASGDTAIMNEAQKSLKSLSPKKSKDH